MAHFSTYENLLVLRPPLPPPQTRPPDHLPGRGLITSFSLGSRRRLTRKLAMVHQSALGPPIFATLTYHRLPPDWLAIYRTFLQRLRREHIRYFWRIELQRKGREDQGRQHGVPHFHLILWPDSGVEIDQELITIWWHELADDSSDAHAQFGMQIRKLGSYRAAMAYVGKYLGKPDFQKLSASSPLYRRRSWGASNTLPLTRLFACDISQQRYDSLKRICRGLLRSRYRKPNRPKPHIPSQYGRSGLSLHADLSLQHNLFRCLENDYSLDLRSELKHALPPPPKLVSLTQSRFW